jgi:hypothetical protein
MILLPWFNGRSWRLRLWVHDRGIAHIFIWLIARITKRVVRKMASAEVLCVVISKFFTQLQTRDTIDGQRIAANRHSARNPCSAEAPETREINFEWLRVNLTIQAGFSRVALAFQPCGVLPGPASGGSCSQTRLLGTEVPPGDQRPLGCISGLHCPPPTSRALQSSTIHPNGHATPGTNSCEVM